MYRPQKGVPWDSQTYIPCKENPTRAPKKES